MGGSRLIHDNDVDRLKRLLAEYPTLLSWHDDANDGGLLGFATGSYGDSFGPVSEAHFSRAACAELLMDAGAVVMPSVSEGLLHSHARGLLQLFRRKGLLPSTLTFFAALGDIAVRSALGEVGDDLAAVTKALTGNSSSRFSTSSPRHCGVGRRHHRRRSSSRSPTRDTPDSISAVPGPCPTTCRMRQRWATSRA